jgi:hypothetical protein
MRDYYLKYVKAKKFKCENHNKSIFRWADKLNQQFSKEA